MTNAPDPILYVPAPRKDRSWSPADAELLHVLGHDGASVAIGVLGRLPRLRSTAPEHVDLGRAEHGLRQSIVWSGVGVSVRDLGNNPSEKTFLFLSGTDVAELMAQSSGFRDEFVTVLERVDRVLVKDSPALRTMVEKFPAYAALLSVSADDTGSEGSPSPGYAGLTTPVWKQIREAVQADSKAVLLLNGTGLAEGHGLSQKTGRHLFWLDTGLVSAPPVPRLDGVSVVTMGVHDKYVSDGRLAPRHGAWQLVSAARRLRASLLITDDPHIVRHLANDDEMRSRLWLVVGEGAEADSDMLEAAALCHRVLCPSEATRTQLERSLVQPDPLRISVVNTEPTETDSRTHPEIDVSELVTLLAHYGPSTPVLDGTRTLLLAGHDFKFLGELVDALEQRPGLNIVYDKWPQQNRRDVAQSDACLMAADIILCEFASHNAVWYSWNKRPGQKLIVHFHGYELHQSWMTDINVSTVDMFVFVSEFYRDKVVAELGWPMARTRVIPNMVDLPDLDRPKPADARFHLGIVGIVPILKRPDRALDLLEDLLAQDDRYVLHVRGRHPWEYQWMWQDPVVRDAYEGFYERLAGDPRLLRHVSFDGFGADMGRWFRRVGWILSPSSRETFHLAPVEGMPGGAVPVVWEREGASEIFGNAWVHGSTSDCAEFIRQHNSSAEAFQVQAQTARHFVQRYGTARVLPLWFDSLFSASAEQAVALDAGFTPESLEEQFRSTPTPAVLERYLRVLIESGELGALEEVLEDEQRLVPELSAVVTDRVEQARHLRAFMNQMSSLPHRPIGAAYTARRSCGVLVDLVSGGQAALRVEEYEVGETTVLAVGEARELRLPEVDRELAPAEVVQLHADALLRYSRVHRPSWIAVGPDWRSLWPALLTGRRLGLPVIRVGGSCDAAESRWAPDAADFDAVLPDGEHLSPAGIRAAAERYRREVSALGARRLEDLRIGIIADEFTTRTVASSCETVVIHRNRGYLQVAAEPLDALILESAWEGVDREWFHGVAFYKDAREDIERIIEVARARSIPVIFWNKEDPVHFKSFAPSAALCDVVFTTDADKLPDYLALDTGGRPLTVGSMPFFAEPSLHNPSPTTREQRHTITYAGTYYGARYAERSAELDSLLEHAVRYGLTIYDRQLNVSNSPYHFPDKYKRFVEGGLPYAEVLEAYKAHPVHINVNSASGSPTMFSRRAVEIAASGSVVLSGTGRGLNECLPAILATDDEDRWSEALERWMNSSTAWATTVWEQLRAVRRSYLAEHALSIMLRTAGIPVAARPRPEYAVVVSHLDLATAEDILRQTWLPARVVANTVDETARAALGAYSVAVSTREEEASEQWVVPWDVGLDVNYAEDVLYAARFAPEDTRCLGARTSVAQSRILEWADEATLPCFRRGNGDSRDQSFPVWIFPEEEL